MYINEIIKELRELEADWMQKIIRKIWTGDLEYSTLRFYTMDCGKSYKSAIHLCNLADDHMKNEKFILALDIYTLGLLNAPTYYLTENATKDKHEKHPLALLYANRSLAMFRSKRYKDCISDIKRAISNGKHDQTRWTTLCSRLAWSYWHLKQYSKCSEAVESATTNSKIICKELEVIKQLISKRQVILENGSNISKNSTEHFNGVATKQKPYSSAIFGGESDEIRGVTSHAIWNYNNHQGRFLTAGATIKPGHVVIDEEAYCGILNEDFIISNCNFCFKECKLDGIPCCGCARALYCDEDCRRQAWQSFHWIECCMWPVLKTLDVFAHLALRILLSTASKTQSETKPKIHSSKTKDSFAMVAECLHNRFNTPQSGRTTGKKKNSKKITKQLDNLLDGRNHGTGYFDNRDYWSIFCLQTHEEDHSKLILTKCSLFASYLAKVLNQVTSLQKRKSVKSANEFAQNSIKETIYNVRSVFSRLSLQNFCGASNENQTTAVDMEMFRRKTLEICKKAAVDAPAAKLKLQSCYFSKELPQTFQDILFYLLRRHMMQLHTNCQAIYDIVVESSRPSGSDVSRVSQQRIASAIFPSASLLNHSCSPNTVLNFVGRKLLVRAAHSIFEGNEITHCYGPSMSRHSFKDRQRLLKEQYYFNCECLTCVKYKAGNLEDQVFLQQFTAYRCESCESPILILDSKPPNDISVQGKCANEACKRIFDLTEAHKNFNMIVSMSNTFSQRILKCPNIDDLIALEKCLNEMKILLFRNHYAIASLHDQLAFHYSERKDFVTAAKHVTSSLKITSMRFGSQSVEVGQEMFKLATLHFNAKNLKEAEKFSQKTLEIHETLHMLDQDDELKVKAMILALKSFNITSDKSTKLIN